MDKKLSKGYEKSPLYIQMISAGTAGCISDIVTFPTDTLKVRAQIEKKRSNLNSFQLVKHIYKTEGVLVFYKGLTAGLQRQFAFASVRIGVYDEIKRFYYKIFGLGELDINVPVRILSGVTAACIAVSVAQPTDVVKIKFQGDVNHIYSSTMNTYASILKTKGVGGLWQGVCANMARNAICNVSEVVVYDVVKDALLKYGNFQDGINLHVTSAIVAGFITTVVTSPVDVIKTRYLNAQHGTYSSARDCASRTIQKEGFMALYKGFTPNVARLISWNLVMWLAFEQIKIQVAQYYNKKYPDK